MDRETAKGKQSGRRQEIQRLIGRSLRAVTDLKALGEIQIKVDCDVLQADGGTRTAAITGGYVALRSEEHTSELQSLMRISYAVFCLKKKITHIRTFPSHTYYPITNIKPFYIFTL